jgi:hypothetical protein
MFNTNNTKKSEIALEIFSATVFALVISFLFRHIMLDSKSMEPDAVNQTSESQLRAADLAVNIDSIFKANNGYRIRGDIIPELVLLDLHLDFIEMIEASGKIFDVADDGVLTAGELNQVLFSIKRDDVTAGSKITQARIDIIQLLKSGHEVASYP